MKTMRKMIWVLVFFVNASLATAQQRQKGFYKDLFMDSGMMLTSRVDLWAARLADFTIESFVSTPHSYTDKFAFTDADTLLQSQLIGGSALDENGILLYPDGAPRFRAVYMNGGRAKAHGTSLGEQGRANYRTFVANGGGYVGSCAGAFIASLGTKLPDKEAAPNDMYLGIWPGYTTGTGLEKSWTDVVIEPNSGEPVVWAYKASEQAGRIVLCGSHPEDAVEGPRLELTAAMLKYAMDGVGKPTVKGELKNGEERRMTCYTHDKRPAYTRIGDKQYHHFTVEVPEGTDTLKITLKPTEGLGHFDLYLFADSRQLAFKDEAEHCDLHPGIGKLLTIVRPKAGTLYVSVFCDTTVEARQTRYGTQYSGRLDVLNGVPYAIRVDF